MDLVSRQGLDLDEGMVLYYAGAFYHGADCIHRLALLTTGSSGFNRLNAMIFRSHRMSRVLYPALRCGRNLALHILGRRKLREEPAASKRSGHAQQS